MNVLLLNGSPHPQGCTFTALHEIALTLKQESIDSSVFQLGAGAVHGCTGCGYCRIHGHCVFTDDPLPMLVSEVKQCDAMIIGSPVYFAGPNGALCALLDRLFFSAGKWLTRKPGAAIVSCRRGGASATFDRLNKYFAIKHMPIVTSQYWNSVHGMTPEEVRRDAEGLQTMRTLAHNLAWLLHTMQTANLPFPEAEPSQSTSFADGKMIS